jgi:hypothetical protein
MDLAEWRWCASQPAKGSWIDRAELASFFIRHGDVVCDLGAGAQPLKQFLPFGVQYIPVDCVDVIPGTHVADFNKSDFALPSKPFNILTALGVFVYIDDLDRFLGRLADECEGKFIIFTHDFWGNKNDPRRKTSAYHQPTELQEGALYFSRYVQDLMAVSILRRRVMFTGTLGRGEPQPLRRNSATEITVANIRPLQYLAMKLFNVNYYMVENRFLRLLRGSRRR